MFPTLPIQRKPSVTNETTIRYIQVLSVAVALSNTPTFSYYVTPSNRAHFSSAYIVGLANDVDVLVTSMI